jgi:endonuclease/exonuclease/phosphatase family metal-dependent hydrolase
MIQAVQRSTAAIPAKQTLTARRMLSTMPVPNFIQSYLNRQPDLTAQPYKDIGPELMSAYYLPQLQRPQSMLSSNPTTANAFNQTTSSGEPAASEENPPPVPLRLVQPHHKLMTYNVENFVRTSKGKSIKSAESIQALGEVILKEDPDVIALQEVGDESLLEEFNRKVLHDKYPNIVCPAAADPSHIRVAMMSKAAIRVLDKQSHLKEMSAGANYSNKRDFLETTFKTETGFRFTVYNAHCKSMRGSEEHTAPIRLQEVRNAAAILKAHFTQAPKAPVLVVGDFNTLHDSPFGKPIIEILTHLGGNVEHEPLLSEVMMKDGKEDPTHNGRGFYPNTKLDYIFASRSMTPQIRKAYVAGDFTQKPWNIASDHLPYVTEFEEPLRGGKSEKSEQTHTSLREKSHSPFMVSRL